MGYEGGKVGGVGGRDEMGGREGRVERKWWLVWMRVD